MRYFIHFVIGLLIIQAPFAESIEASDFETKNQQSRYTQLIENIRCPVCQGPVSYTHLTLPTILRV